MKIAVIGAGVTGVTTAYELLKDTHEVVLYDRLPYAGMHTSYANGGQLSVCNSEVWTSPATLLKGMKWMFHNDAPLLFNPKPSIPKMRWIAGFLKNTFNGTADQHTIDTIKIGLRARELYFQMADELGLEFSLKKKGILHFYRDIHSYNVAKESLPLFHANGVNRITVTPDEIVAIEPALAHIKSTLIGGTYTQDDASGDIHQFCVSMIDYLRSKGVETMFDTEVSTIAFLEDGRQIVVSKQSDPANPMQLVIDTRLFDKIVICGGVDSPRLSRMVGDNLNIYPVKGYSITLPIAEGQSSPQVSLLDEATKIVSSNFGDRLRVAGTAELADWNYDIRADRIKPLVNWTRVCFPWLSVEDTKPWAGLRPMTPSMLPVVQESKRSPGVFYNTGHGHLGWTMAPATAEAVCDLIRKSSV